jgi:hypothetical protein
MRARWIYLRQSLFGIDQAPLREPYPAAQCDIDSYPAVLIQHFFRALEGEFRSFDSQPGLRQF